MPTDENPEELPVLPSEIINLKRFAYSDDKTWSLFNPSIAQSSRGKLAIAFRSSNYVILDTGELHVTVGGTIKNKVFFADTNSDFELINLREITVPDELMDTPRGMEDPKLFWRGTAWHMMATVMEKHTPYARMAMCKLNSKCTEVSSIEMFDGIEVRKPEKNWMAPDKKKSANFDFIYGPNSIIKGKQVIFTMTSEPKFTGLRGNSHLVEQSDGTYIAVMHRLWSKKTMTYVPNNFGYIEGKDKNYAHFFARFDKFGQLIQLSQAFQFVDRGIEFAAGLVEIDGNFVVSFGKSDVSSHLSVLPKERVIEMLEDIGQ